MDDDRLLLAQAEDLISRCRQRDIPTYSGFLDARQQSLLRRTFGVRQGDVSLVYYGGYEEADRVILACLPYYMEVPEDPGTSLEASDTSPEALGTACEDQGAAAQSAGMAALFEDVLTVIRATAPKGSGASSGGRALSHSDYLGAILGTGIKRSVIGDILVREDGADIIAAKDMADYLLQNFTSAGRANLSLEEVPLTEIRVPEVSFQEITDTVASLRLDAVLASAFRISRGKAAEAVRQGLVFVDHLEASKADMPVSEGSELVIRHLGKAKILEVGGRSRKDRIGIRIARYSSR